MKMSQERYEQLRHAIERVADFYGPNAVRTGERFNVGFSKDQNMALRWALFTVAVRNLSFGDDHPYFASGRWDRIIPHVEGFTVQTYYNEGLHDDHIDTALRKIQKDFDLFRPQATVV